jgi:hypothetical protein
MTTALIAIAVGLCVIALCTPRQGYSVRHQIAKRTVGRSTQIAVAIEVRER